MPDEYSNLCSIIKRKYEEFKQGKETYTILYVDEENELINVSDDEDYAVFQDYQSSNIGTAKLFLTHRGEETDFNPLIDDTMTVNESVIMDEDIAKLQTMRSSVDNPFLGFKQEAVNNQLIMQIKNQLSKLMND